MRITATMDDIDALAAAGADIVAFDATAYPRPVPAADLLAAIHRHGRIAMADISTAREAETAARLGADFVGTTLSGYMEGPIPDAPDLALVRAIAGCGRPVIAEGRIRTPDQAKAAIRRVRSPWSSARRSPAPSTLPSGSRPRWRTPPRGGRHERRFDPRDRHRRHQDARSSRDRRKVDDERDVATPRDRSAEGWCDGLAALVADWVGRYKAVAAAVTGQVKDGRWYT